MFKNAFNLFVFAVGFNKQPAPLADAFSFRRRLSNWAAHNLDIERAVFKRSPMENTSFFYIFCDALVWFVLDIYDRTHGGT